jgi:hypothetical protein
MEVAGLMEAHLSVQDVSLDGVAMVHYFAKRMVQNGTMYLLVATKPGIAGTVEDGKLGRVQKYTQVINITPPQVSIRMVT